MSRTRKLCSQTNRAAILLEIRSVTVASKLAPAPKYPLSSYCPLSPLTVQVQTSIPTARSPNTIRSPGKSLHSCQCADRTPTSTSLEPALSPGMPVFQQATRRSTATLTSDGLDWVSPAQQHSNACGINHPINKAQWPKIQPSTSQSWFCCPSAGSNQPAHGAPQPR